MKRAALVLALGLALGLHAPQSALAQQHGGRPGGGGGGARPAPAARSAPAAPAARPAPAAPQTRPAGGGGFNFGSDVGAPRPAPRPPGNGTPGTRPPGNSTPGTRPPAPGSRPPGGRPPVVVRPPAYRPGPSWGWNRGVVWAPAPNYWGGGFWGSLAIAAASAAIYGSIVADNDQTYTSYQVQPNSPGAILLQNYQLQQVPCGPPGLVVIYGPDNSVICAAPNDLVAPGYYNLDPSNLTIVSQ